MNNEETKTQLFNSFFKEFILFESKSDLYGMRRVLADLMRIAMIDNKLSLEHRDTLIVITERFSSNIILKAIDPVYSQELIEMISEIKKLCSYKENKSIDSIDRYDLTEMVSEIKKLCSYRENPSIIIDRVFLHVLN